MLMWTEMPKLGWMSSSQTQTISKFPWLRNSHITFESKSSRGKGTSQCGTEGATSAYQGSEFRCVFLCFMSMSLWCVYAVFDVSSHQAPGIGSTIDLSCLVANVELIQLWCPMKRIVCADEITQSCACSMVMLFFPHLLTRQHCVHGTCC